MLTFIRRVLFVLFLAAWLGFAGRAHAATYYVAQRHPAAADGNDGSEQHPWKTIGRAAQAAKPGDIVLIQSGVYRETVTIQASGAERQPIRFEAAPMANVVVTGTDPLTHWQREPGAGNVFSTTWNHEFIGWNPNHAHPDDEYHRLIGRCEQVFVMGYPLRQVLTREKLARGTFYVDLPGKRLHVWSSDNRDLSKGGTPVEASTRQTLWDCKGSYVQTRGLRFRYAANMAQHGAASFSGKHDVIEDCTFERTNGSGATFEAEDIVVRNCTFRDNGQLGFGAGRAHRLLFTGCLVCDNNVKGFNRDWEAGGDKLVLCRAAVLENSRFLSNRGHGIWFDIGNEDCAVHHCLIADNEDAGIFDEISFGLHVHDNIIIGNGLAGTPGTWGASGGVCLSSSPGSVVERNLLVGNKEGLSFREATRTTPRIDAPKGQGEQPVWNHDETIRHNVLAYNRDAQVWGWFDIDDQRQWPAAMQEHKGQSPASLSLETLHLALSENLYAAQPGQSLLHWGVLWKRNKSYDSLDEVRRELGLEQGSQTQSVAFRNYAQRDFRNPPDSPAIRLNCYPQGEVPGARLGTAGGQ